MGRCQIEWGVGSVYLPGLPVLQAKGKEQQKNGSKTENQGSC